MEYLTVALQLDPDHFLAHQILAEVHELAKNSTEAIKSARSAVELNPESITCLQLLARTLQSAGHLEESYEHLSRAAQLSKGAIPTAILTDLVSLASDIGLHGQLEEWLKPLSVDAALKVSTQFVKASKYKKASDVLRALLAVHPSNPSVVDNLARVLHVQGAAAVTEADTVFRQYANEIGSYEAFMLHGHYLRDTNRKADALRYYKRALAKLDEGSKGQQSNGGASQEELIKVLTHIVDHQLALHLDDDAVRSLERIVGMQPNDAKAHFQIANLVRQTDVTKAEHHYKQAIAVSKTPDASYVANFAALLHTLSRYEEAEEQYNRALALDPNTPNARDNLQRMKTSRGYKKFVESRAAA
jgi:tetratricopeptide (TPR) repeat protein